MLSLKSFNHPFLKSQYLNIGEILGGIEVENNSNVIFYHAENSKGEHFFIKYADKKSLHAQLEAEYKGLKHLANMGQVRTPKIFNFAAKDSNAALALEFIHQGRKQNHHQLGVELAKMHRKTQKHFGLNYENYIATLVQKNNLDDNYEHFWATQRIGPLIKIAKDLSYLNSTHLKQTEALLYRCHEVVPKEQPALLHGDLWCGNVLFDLEGEPVFIDPAVYYGHREVDLAMMKLFGGFDNETFVEYNNCFPLEVGWQNRLDYHQLYYLLVHLVIFGIGYLPKVEFVLKKYGS